MRSESPTVRASVQHGRDARVTLALAVIVVGGVIGCGRSGATRSTDASTRPAVAARGRTQMWAENCNRCHNARPAGWYSRREWAVSMHHMQVRGYLTGEETRGITEFFRATSK
jgi:hypothetical protein